MSMQEPGQEPQGRQSVVVKATGSTAVIPARCLQDVPQIDEFYDGWDDAKEREIKDCRPKIWVINAAGGSIDLQRSLDPRYPHVVVLVRSEPGCATDIRIWDDQRAGSFFEDIRVLVGPGSTIRLLSVRQGKEMDVESERRVKVAAGGTIAWTDVDAGGRRVRKKITCRLTGIGASCDAKMYVVAGGSDEVQLTMTAIHEARATVSRNASRSVLLGNAHADCRGLIKIGADAAGSDGFERLDAALLSDCASASAIPDLVINNHDVRCGHGSAIGKADQEKLFYLMAHGLGRTQALRLMAEGFLMPGLDDPELRDVVGKAISEALA